MSNHQFTSKSPPGGGINKNSPVHQVVFSNVKAADLFGLLVLWCMYVLKRGGGLVQAGIEDI